MYRLFFIVVALICWFAVRGESQECRCGLSCACKDVCDCIGGKDLVVSQLFARRGTAQSGCAGGQCAVPVPISATTPPAPIVKPGAAGRQPGTRPARRFFRRWR